MSQPDVLLLVQECLKNSGKAKFFPHFALNFLSFVYSLDISYLSDVENRKLCVF